MENIVVPIAFEQCYHSRNKAAIYILVHVQRGIMATHSTLFEVAVVVVAVVSKVSSATWLTVSVIWSFKISRTTFLNCTKLASPLILRVRNCETTGRENPCSCGFPPLPPSPNSIFLLFLIPYKRLLISNDQNQPRSIGGCGCCYTRPNISPFHGLKNPPICGFSGVQKRRSVRF